ncbi:hypothetical protein [Methylobacterium oxalidis]|nr:hypothetical protein [Methylobacterium oxalidis]GJE34643.1 hypothetical protein LDDCCGHA_4855 [Methylobacterium oxalidis]
MRPATSLASLPSASAADFGGQPPWSVISTTTLVAALRIDRGNFATWRCRGIGPAELPTSWFRPASGRPRYYLVSHVLAWIAARHAQPFDYRACWLDYLVSIHMPTDLAWARRLAEREGPVQNGVVFTVSGWRAYLDSLDLDHAPVQA